MAKIAYIEEHDARVTAVHLHSGSRSEILFSQLAVYLRAPPLGDEIEAFEVWLYPARLVLEDTVELTCDGPLSEEVLMDGDVFGRNGEPLAWVDLRETSAIARVHLRFSGGTDLQIGCSGGRLILGERLRYLERWSGSLGP